MDSNRKGSIEFASRFESTIINSENEDLWVQTGQISHLVYSMNGGNIFKLLQASPT